MRRHPPTRNRSLTPNARQPPLPLHAPERGKRGWWTSSTAVVALAALLALGLTAAPRRRRAGTSRGGEERRPRTRRPAGAVARSRAVSGAAGPAGTGGVRSISRAQAGRAGPGPSAAAARPVKL